MSKKYNTEIRAWGTVEMPVSFVWRGRLYRVISILQTWKESCGFWQKRELRHCYLLSAASRNGQGVYEIYYVAQKQRWFMARVVD